jgi:hypothetical protein
VQRVEAGLVLDLLQQHHVGVERRDRLADLVGAVVELALVGRRLEVAAPAVAAVAAGVEEQAGR